MNAGVAAFGRLAFEAAVDRSCPIRLLQGKRGLATFALRLDCGLRRPELTEITIDHLQRGEEHWASVARISRCIYPTRTAWGNEMKKKAV